MFFSIALGVAAAAILLIVIVSGLMYFDYDETGSPWQAYRNNGRVDWAVVVLTIISVLTFIGGVTGMIVFAQQSTSMRWDTSLWAAVATIVVTIILVTIAGSRNKRTARRTRRRPATASSRSR